LFRRLAYFRGQQLCGSDQRARGTNRRFRNIVFSLYRPGVDQEDDVAGLGLPRQLRPNPEWEGKIMRSRTFTWLVALGVLVALPHLAARAGNTGWSFPAPAGDSSSCPATLGQPIPLVTLGQPIPLPDAVVQPVAWRAADTQTSPTAAEDEAPFWVPRLTVRAQMAEEPRVSLYGPPPVPPPSTNPNPFPPPNSVPAGPPPPPPSLGPAVNQGVAVDQPLTNGVWNKCSDFWKDLTHTHSGCNGHCFQSDQGFCETPFISPVTSPFLAMNPLSLTEIRPIFMYQTIPTSNPLLGGGSAEFYGVQGSLAFNEQFSLVVNKLGLVSLEPKAPLPPYSKSTGFAELWLGPKFTFFRCPGNGTAIAGGLTFQLPVGNDKVFQGTGDFGLDPYISFAQNIRLWSYGSINLMNTTGYSLSLDNKRSDYFHSSFHVDYDVINAHKYFPFLELNWYQYTTAGKVMTQDFEGTDLFNFGANGVQGRGYVTLAPGMRYRFCENFQVGAAAEWKLYGPSGVNDFRLTLDLIFRY